jgi:Heterokaryon incompatibility protein (HET)
MLEALTCDNIDSPKPSKHESNRVSPNDNKELQGLPIKFLLEWIPRVYSHWHDDSTMSPANLSLALFWLNNCIKLHRPCQQFQIRDTLPTRIIDVSDPDHPLLVDGENRSCQYVTLSYKWGISREESRKYSTTKEKLSQHQTGISLQKLPLTFKDAIYVTNALGFRWLWIDALCIIQDCNEDLEKEIVRMDQTFRYSTLTLFAAAGDDVFAGLRASRDPRCVKPCRLNLKTTLNEKTMEGTAYITIDRRKEYFPLFDRGWVLQEQVLASRGLIFGSDQLHWRCLCGYSNESRPEPKGRIESNKELGEPRWDKWRGYSPGWDGFDKMRLWLMGTNALPDQPVRVPDLRFGGSFSTRDNQFDSWYSLVSAYTRRSLTSSSDIFHALAGIAGAMAYTHQYKYILGLWQEDLQIGLTWYVVNGGSSLEAGSLNLPSWTWASKWGQRIEFRTWYNECDIVTHEGIQSVSLANQEEVSRTGDSATITNRALQVTGRLRMALLSPIPDFWNNKMSFTTIREDRWKENSFGKENGRWVSNIMDPITKETVGQIAFDSDPNHSAPKEIHCLLCSAKRRDDSSSENKGDGPWVDEWQLTCLGLSPTGRSDEEYSRIGLVFLWRTGWFGDLDKVLHKVPHMESLNDMKTIRLV